MKIQLSNLFKSKPEAASFAKRLPWKYINNMAVDAVMLFAWKI